jgi:tetratricopeptide (TPR) repeat protein
LSAKPVVLILCCRVAAACATVLLGLSGAMPAAAKAPLPVVLLYPETSGDITALVDLRTRLRLDGHVDVLTYDPESAAIKRVAAEASHPEWLLSAPAKDDDRLVLARALGVAFYAVVSPGRTSDSTHVELVETAISARTFDWSGTNRQFGVRAIESQVADSLAHPLVLEASNPPSETPPTPAGPDLPPPALTTPVLASGVVSAPTVTTPTPAPIVVPAPSVPAAALPVPLAAPSVPIVIPLPAGLTVPPVKPTFVPTVIPKPSMIPKPLAPAESPVVTAIKTAPRPLTLPETQIAPPLPVTVPPVVSALPVVPPQKLAPILKSGPLAPNSGGTGTEMARPSPALTRLKTLGPTIGPQIAMLPRPKPYVPEPDTPETLPLPLPGPTPERRLHPEDLRAIAPLMTKGDSALDGGDFVGAISYFRQAINGAPLSVVPRLKLAQAYEREGLSDKALDEARRALEIAPDSAPVLQLLTDLDQQNGTSDGTLIRYRAQIERSPSDPTAHIGLANALWNSGDLEGAETEYKAAKALAPVGDHAADAHLAQLYSTEARYDDALSALQNAGSGGYALAIKIVKNRAETLSSTLDASRDAFNGGKSTREQFYDDAKKLSAQAQGLAGFVAKVTPPPRYKLSHLHRMLSTNLLAQEAAMLVSFIETGDAQQSDSVATLEKAAATEMLTAQATEENLGLWTGKKPTE